MEDGGLCQLTVLMKKELRSVHTPRYLPCDAVRYRNRVQLYSTAIAARLRRCVNVALQHIPTHAGAAVACGNPALSKRDLRWIAVNCGGSKTTASHRK